MASVEFTSVLQPCFSQLPVSSDFGTKHPDQYERVHSNKCVVVIGLSSTHPLVQKGVKQIIPAQRLLDGNRGTSGKFKRGAVWIGRGSPMFEIIDSDGQSHSIVARCDFELLELNENVLKNPILLSTEPQSAGFLCLGLIRQNR